MVTAPFGVLNEIWPEPVDEGVLRDRELDVAAVGDNPRVLFIERRSLASDISKFAPAMVNAVPAATI